MSGWIKLHRKLKDHWVWRSTKFTEGQAWIDILLRVNHEQKTTSIDGKLIEVNPGQTIWSIAKMAIRWGWSRGKVSRFLRTLCESGMISQKRTSKYTVITVSGWSFHQGCEHQNGHQNDIRMTSDGHQNDTTNNEKNEKNEKNTNTFSSKKIKSEKFKKALIDEWEKKKSVYLSDYPSKDCQLEYELMIDWIESNPLKASKKKNPNLFIRSWLNRSSNVYRKKPTQSELDRKVGQCTDELDIQEITPRQQWQNYIDMIDERGGPEKVDGLARDKYHECKKKLQEEK